jgi:hypothetical protein
MKIDHVTHQEKAEIIAAARAAAAALAKVWDLLDKAEDDYCVFDGISSFIEELASMDEARVDDATIWQEIEQMWRHA